MKTVTYMNNARVITGYLVSVFLVVIYVNMFPVVKYVVLRWGNAPVLILPIAVTLATLTAILYFYFKRDYRGLKPPKTRVVTAGIILCLLALSVPDPAAPVKRIHVPEYMLLSLVVRYSMSFHLQKLPLLFFCILFSILLGVHDELLQGFHPLRTYGLKDIAVNSLGSAGGALIWHGLQLYCRPDNQRVHKNTQGAHNRAAYYLSLLLLSVAALAVVLYFYREKAIPFWPAIPLLLSFIVFLICSNKGFPEQWKHGILAVSWASFLMVPYIVICTLTCPVFY